MTTPLKTKVLTRLRINEISMVDRGAGENCRIVISKRDDGSDNFDKWHREQARIAEEQNERHLRKHARKWRSFNEVLAENTAKSFAADARGDEADDQDEATSVDELVGGDEHHASKVADLLVESGSHKNRQDALAYLLHHPRGAAMLQRLNKEDTTMPTNNELHAFAKQAGVVAIAKRLVEAGDPHEITQEQLVALISKHERRDGETEAQTFARHFEAPTAEGALFRRAIEVAKTAEAAPVYDPKPLVVDEVNVNDPAEAIRQLKELGRQKWPDASEAEQFERAFFRSGKRRDRGAYLHPLTTRITATMTSSPYDIAKRDGVIALAKRIVEEDNAFGLDEHQLTNLTITTAKRDHPQMSDAQAFAKVFSDSSADGVALRKAFTIVKNAAHAGDTSEADDAMRELAAIGARRFPHLTKAQQFAKAAECNPSLLAKAHKRPSAASSFPFPE